MGLYDDLRNLFPINGKSFQRKPKLIATPHILEVVLCLYLKRYLFQNKLQRKGLEHC